MAVEAKCPERECPFVIEDGMYAEDCMDKMKAHYRMEHKTRFLNEESFEDHVHIYNSTLDECIEAYLGRGWREAFANDPASVANSCRRIYRQQQHYRPALIREIVELARANGMELEPADGAAPDEGVANAQVQEEVQAQMLRDEFVRVMRADQVAPAPVFVDPIPELDEDILFEDEEF